MERFLIELAGVRIAVQAFFAETRAFCADYLVEESAGNDALFRDDSASLAEARPAALRVTMTAADLEAERWVFVAQDQRENIPVRSYSDQYLETLALYRKISEALLSFDTLLFHGSAIAVDGEAYVFAAKSGTGKSTHARLWREMLGERAWMVNDDKPLLRVCAPDDAVQVYGTPWNGKHRLSENSHVPLRAVCFLKQGKENRIRRLRPAEALERMLQQTYCPKLLHPATPHVQSSTNEAVFAGQGADAVETPANDPGALMRILDLLDRLSAKTHFYEMDCLPNREAAALSFSTMTACAGKTGRPC